MKRSEVWTLWRDGVRVDCEVLDGGARGLRVELRRGGYCIHSRWFTDPLLARAEVEALYIELTRDGWQSRAAHTIADRS